MIKRMARAAADRRSAVTTAAVLILLVNLLFAGYVRPPDVLGDDLPMAASCQGGGPGCAEQPMLPPASIGLPHFEQPPAPVLGVLTRIQQAAPSLVREGPPLRIDHPPAVNLA